ncbi:MAG: type II secretion system F family protein [Mobilicoccus sp.]|nr:type II secretion system F family protein [Mobilicoccus sp.]
MTVLAGVLTALAVLVLIAAPRRQVLHASIDPPTPAVEIADVATLLALALRSGRGTTDAIAAVAERVGGRLGADLATVVAAHGWGMTDEQAWALVDPAWEPVARAFLLAGAAGLPPSTTLASAAHDIRRAEEHRLEVESERLGVRLVLPLGATFLPAFVATTVVPVVGALAGSILAG